MENNKYLQAQEALDVRVLLQNVPNDIAFQIVVELFTKAHEEIRDLEEYFDYIWIEHGNGVRWDYAVEKHNHSQAQLNDLEILLGDLLATQAKDWKGIPQLIGDKPIDIKYLLYEMPSDLGIDFINNYLEHINDVLHHFELEKGSPKDDDERKRVVERLEELQDQLIAIRNDEANSLKEFEKEWEKIQLAEEEERREMWELVHQKEHQTTEIEVNEKEAAISSTVQTQN